MPNPRIPKDDAAGWRKEALRQREALKQLTVSVGQAIAALDEIMKQPSTLERAKRVVQVLTALEMAKDAARFFALDVDWRKERNGSVKNGPNQ